MKRLAELQRNFQRCLVAPPGASCHPWIRDDGRAAPERQLAVYIHAYAARLKEVLTSDYPAVRVAIGEDAFEKLCQAYLETHPSHYFSLRDFGARLTSFIADEPAYCELPWLEELARFEWALGQAFDAGDTAIARIEDMAAIEPQHWPALRFELHPSAQYLDFRWNTPGMWSELTAAQPSPVTAIESEPTHWLIWREQLTTRFRSVSVDEQVALNCARNGGNFSQICERLAAVIDADTVPLRAASLIKGWLGHGLISAVRHSHNV